MDKYLQSELRAAFSNIKTDFCALKKEKQCQILH